MRVGDKAPPDFCGSRCADSCSIVYITWVCVTRAHRNKKYNKKELGLQ